MYPFAHREFVLAREEELRLQAERDRQVHAAISDRRTLRRRNRARRRLRRRWPAQPATEGK
jgi:hypothetical protein